MGLPLIFKRDNPGCPCCGLRLIGGGDGDYGDDANSVCACYPFDDHANNVVFDGLHLTSTLPSYDAGILANASKHTGSEHHEHAHHVCYTPTAGDGLRIWFWLKMVTLPGEVSSFQGVVTKGRLDVGPPPIFTGEWGIFLRTNGAYDQTTDLNFVLKTSTVALHIPHSVHIKTGIWYFIHWTLNATDALSDLTIYNADTDAEFGGAAVGIVGEFVADPAESMRVGNNTDGDILGADYGELLIDNLGFTHGASNAATLYNSGSGVACPASGG